MISSQASKSKPYFQFPLRALWFGEMVENIPQERAKVRLHEIIKWCIWDVACRLEEYESLQEEAERELTTQKAFTVDDLDNLTKCKLIIAARTLNVSLGSSVIREYREQALPQGSSMQVRLRNDIFWDCMDWEWRDTASLCAIYAAIGAERYRRITYGHIATLACGNAKPNDETRALCLKDHQVRHTVEKLELRGFFVRMSPNHRDNFYSHSLTQSQLFETLVSRGVKRERKRQSDVTDQLKKAILAKLEEMGP